MPTNNQNRDMLNLTIKALSRRRVPSGTGVIVLAKVVHRVMNSIKKSPTWLTIIALALSGAYLLVTHVTPNSLKTLIYQRVSDELTPKALPLPPDTYPGYELLPSPDWNPDGSTFRPQK